MLNKRGDTRGHNIGGRAPPEIQCKFIKSNGERCKAVSRKDNNGIHTGFCYRHGGRIITLRNDGLISKWPKHMPSFYKTILCKKLQALVAEHNSKAPAEQVQLYEELALVRANANEAVKLYSGAVVKRDALIAKKEAGELDEEGRVQLKKLETAVLTTGEFMVKALKDVGEMATRIIDNENKKKSDLSVLHVHALLNQIVRIVWESAGDDLTMAEEIVENIKDRIVLPTGIGEVKGTSIRPDEEVLAMDDTVPALPNPDHE